MVIKTQLCAFSENRIYPGHGSMCCRRDGQNFFLSSKKSKAMYEQRKKPQKIAWTQAWRRLHKKNVDNRQKKKVSPFLYLKKSEHGVGSPPPSSDVGRWSRAGVCWLGWLVSCDGISTLGKGNGGRDCPVSSSPPFKGLCLWYPCSCFVFVLALYSLPVEEELKGRNKRRSCAATTSCRESLLLLST